jgi:hypothetical protein
METIKLPSEFQMGDAVHLTFWSNGSHGAWISAVQFVKSEKGFKVFYDLDVIAMDGENARFHRVDERMIKRYYKNGEYSN